MMNSSVSDFLYETLLTFHQSCGIIVIQFIREVFPMKEIWKPATLIDSRTSDGSYRYEVSNLGRVRSAAHSSKSGLDVPAKVLKVSSDGIINIHVGHRSRGFLVSKLVAMEFVPNPNLYGVVDYKDGNPDNICADNLVWRSASTCSNGGRPVQMCDADGNVVKEFDSVEAAVRETGYGNSAIRICLRDNSRTTGGFYWRYAYEVSAVQKSRRSKRMVSPDKVSSRNSIETRQYTTDGKLVKVWKSAKLAAVTIGVSPATLSKACGSSAKRKTCAGFIWRKATDDEFAEANGLSVVIIPKVRQYTKSGEFVAEYSTPIEAAEATGVNNSVISKLCNDGAVEIGRAHV